MVVVSQRVKAQHAFFVTPSFKQAVLKKCLQLLVLLSGVVEELTEIYVFTELEPYYHDVNSCMMNENYFNTHMYHNYALTRYSSTSSSKSHDALSS